MKRTMGIVSLLALMAMSHATWAQEDASFPITSLKEVLIPKDKLPKGWTLLGERLVRDQHDINLLATVDGTAETFGIEISEKLCQPLKIGDESFNVDFFMLKKKEGVEMISGILEGWLNPGQPGDIHWTHRCWASIIMVVSTSNEKTQKEVIARYFGNLLELIDNKANEFVKQGEQEKALKCYTFLADKIQDLPHAYQLCGSLFQYEAQDYKNAISSYEHAIKDGGDKNFTPEELWDIHEGIGLCAGLSKDAKKAEAEFLKALDVAKTSKNEKLVGESNYNLACAYAEKGDKEKMYKYLEEAVKLDGEYAAKAPKDSSFAKYIQEPRFKKLMGTNSK